MFMSPWVRQFNGIIHSLKIISMMTVEVIIINY